MRASAPADGGHVLLSMTPNQRYWWKIALELKLRKYHGDAFQDFFCTVMLKVHGDDFVRVRAFGTLGDKGCDGYLLSVGQVFQCYGALDGGGDGKVAYLIGKMGDDYAKAARAIGAIMQEWHMVHNFVDGLPIEAVQKLRELEKADQKRKFGFVSIEGFEERIFALDMEEIEELLGPTATAADAHNLQTSELRDLVAAVAGAADDVKSNVDPIKPVPVEKLVFNKLPGHWHSLIAGGWQNAHHVSTYLSRHHDPLVGEKIAQMFRDRYAYLKAQNLQPGAIMSALYEVVTGVGSVTPSRQVAAQALLAFLFESCDIFEDIPSKTN
jgi:hypothetical protein